MTSRFDAGPGSVVYEHPRFDMSYCPPIPAGWQEMSWHNDAMPMWCVPGPTPLCVWVDYFTKDLGDFPDVEGWRRYCVCTMDPPPADHPEWGPQASDNERILYHGSDWDEALWHVEAWRVAGVVAADLNRRMAEAAAPHEALGRRLAEAEGRLR